MSLSRLEKIDESLWVIDGATVSFYGFPYPTRSVVIGLPNTRLWVWSPIKLDDDLRSEIDGIGQPAHVVSPNKLHNLYLTEWKAAYPTAKLWGPQSTINRFPTLTFAGALGDAPPFDWRADIDQAWFRGSFVMDEVVFFHRASGTAIFADLIESFHDTFLQRNWSWWRRAHWPNSTESRPPILGLPRMASVRLSIAMRLAQPAPRRYLGTSSA